MPERDDTVLNYIEAVYAAADQLADGGQAYDLASAMERLRRLDANHPMLPALQAKLDALSADGAVPTPAPRVAGARRRLH
ncbi:hypothetical protein [Salinarimonas soli]|uniref:Uncharacterized protein n=1 Tax=Salinarimonas soli TaxID=1638099 RepID=A0A5B2VU61_9HYPH|nr:hypothetical protein [Salinarimonas soli]KAA2242324.1 hypothetical protein F0L46_03300 [Salinarimonas soli]